MSPQSPSPNPLLFISHKHSDKKIADAISSFITVYSGGRIKVFQSSSPWTDAPRVGRNLNKELRETLWNTSALILIYTAADQDWSYCMWECGVASHPQSPDTKIIVFQCAGSSPMVFVDQVNVNVRDLVDIQKFTSEFLTSADFFPGFSKPTTKFHSNGREVASAAADLFQKLEPVLPPDKIDPAIEWPAYPFLQLELGFADVDRIQKLAPRNRSASANEIIKQECSVSAADKYCEQLFGVLGFANDLTLKQLADGWKEKFPHSRSKWLDALCTQLIAGALWKFPTSFWDVMQGYNDNTWRAPVLTRVRRIPSRQCMQFDIYFFKFDADAEGKSISIAVPSSSKRRKATKASKASRGRKGVRTKRKPAKAIRRKTVKASKSPRKKKAAKK